MEKRDWCVRLRHELPGIILVVIGAFLTAAATVVFFTPNKIVCGGVSGISTILYHLFSLPMGVSYAVINIALLLVGFRFLGREFVIKTVIGSLLLSGFMEILVRLPVLTYDPMLATVFGGILYGVGLGLIFVARASTGGTDILGRILQRISPNIPIGTSLAIIDGLVIAVSFIVFKDANLILFGIIGVFLQSITIDFLIKKCNTADMILVVTDREEEVKEYVRNTYDRGVTEVEAYGYANEEKTKKLLICLMKSKETAAFRAGIEAVDPDAFIMFSEAKTVLGKGFRYYS